MSLAVMFGGTFALQLTLSLAQRNTAQHSATHGAKGAKAGLQADVFSCHCAEARDRRTKRRRRELPQRPDDRPPNGAPATRLAEFGGQGHPCCTVAPLAIGRNFHESHGHQPRRIGFWGPK